jgi:4-hydroxybenzoate polyprenyltransferase
MLTTVKGLYMAARKFPYGQYLITVFPFYAILILNGFINSLYSLLLLLPFIAVMVAGFMYNTICDAPTDPKEKNPIGRGDISKRNTLIGMILSIIASILFFILLYKSYVAFLFFLFYIFLWLAYSGSKIRFKETFLGPLIASIVLFIGTPFIILLEFNYFNYSSILLLLGLLVIYIAHEIKHTIKDYDVDKSYNCKTFAIIFGRKYSSITEYLLLTTGFVFLLGSSYLIGNSYYFNIIFLILVLISIILLFYYGIKTNYNIENDLYNYMPYIITRVFIIVYACLVLNLSPLLILFIIWISFL